MHKFLNFTVATAYHNIFNSKHGDIVIQDLMKRYHILDTTYHPNDTPERAMYREGQRSVVLHIIALANIKRSGAKLHQELYENFMKESNR